MNATERKKWLFEQIVRLRRAERAHPDDRDIVAVRVELEQELGGALSPSLAASLLGVSHTALLRWVRSGDVPVATAATGRMAIPVRSVAVLYESVVRGRENGSSSRHALAPTLGVGRTRARELQPQRLVPATGSGDRHERALRRSLAYHRALAPRLDRAMIDEARHTLWALRLKGTIDERWADEWEALLDRPVAELRRAIASDTSHAADLRQNSPFAGQLSEAERRRIHEEIR